MGRVFNDKGFTLIELMLVVAIIGVLSSIAIPNFLDFRSKARQAEATSNLGAIFTDEQSYFAMKDTFSDDLILIGTGVTGSYKRYDFTANETFAPGKWVGLSGIPGNGPPVGTVINLDVAPYATNIGFVAIAVGDIDGDGIYDTYSINNNGRLHNDYSDILH